MKKKQDIPVITSVNGKFITVAMVRDSNNMQSFSVVSIEVRDGQVVDLKVQQSDTAEISFNKADHMIRTSYLPIEEVLK